MTVAWWLTAYLIPRAMAAGSPAATLASASSGSLGSSVTRTDRMLGGRRDAHHAGPAPGPWPRPAMRLAMAVPWMPQNCPPGARPEWV